MLDLAASAASAPPLLRGEMLQWIIVLLLALLLVAVIMGVSVLRNAIRESRPPKSGTSPVDRHIVDLSAFLASDRLDDAVDQVLLLEAALAVKIEERMQRLGDISPEAFAEVWERNVYKPTTLRDIVREMFSSPAPRHVVEKLFDKVLKVLNKKIGIE